jgi:hypothetical protein
MEHDMHENLHLLDQVIEELDPSPAELLILFNHLLGRVSLYVRADDWRAALDGARLAVPQSRSEAP